MEKNKFSTSSKISELAKAIVDMTFGASQSLKEYKTLNLSIKTELNKIIRSIKATVRV